MKINNETKIGLMISVVLVLLGILTIKTEKIDFSKKGHIVKVQFKNINGVNLNSPVMYNGYEIGVVEDIVIKDIDNDIKMELTLRLGDEAQVRIGAKAFIKNLGLMGEKFIGLTSGNKNEPLLPFGVTIIGEESSDFENLIHDGEDIAIQLKEISYNINALLKENRKNVDEILTSVNAALKNVTSIAGNVDEILGVNKSNIDSIMINLTATTKNLEEMSHDLKLHPWKIMYRSQDEKKRKRRKSRLQDNDLDKY